MARVLDTREEPWVDPPEGEAFAGTNVKVKVLTREPAGWPSAQLLWVPPGLDSINPHHKPERHYHRTVREWVYVLDGELPYREYASIDDREGMPVLYRPGFFLDRQPGRTSVHGMDAGKGRVHAVCIEVREGPGTAPGERGNHDQNVSITDDDLDAGLAGELPDDGPPRHAPSTPRQGAGVVHSTATVTLLDTRALPWEEGGVKVLSRFDGGGVRFRLVSLPAGAEARVPDSAYVIAGSLAVDGGEALAGAFVEDAEATAGPGGAFFLDWRRKEH